MKVVSIINYKGGVGKTTVTSNLAVHVASKGKRVLMIDVDPQTNLTFSFIDNIKWSENFSETKTLKNFFYPIVATGKKKTSLENLIIPLDVSGIKLDIISSHLELLSIDTDLAAHLSAATLPMLATNFITVHNYFREDVEILKEKYDLILIDCAPSFNIVTKNALVASDMYLTPSKMDFLSTFGVEQLIRNVDKFITKYNGYMQTVEGTAMINPKLLGVVATMVDVYAGELIGAQKNYWNILESQGHEIFKAFIRDNSYFAKAPSDGIPAVISKNTPLNVANELSELGDAFIKKAMI